MAQEGKLIVTLTDKIQTERKVWKFDVDYYINKVLEYLEKNGSFKGITQDPEIGVITRNLRATYKGRRKCYKLTPEMIDKLNAINFEWESPRSEWFEEFFNKLKDYKEKHGSFKCVASDDELRYTVGTVRSAYNGKRPDVKLTPEMIERLNEIGFEWKAKSDWFAPFLEKLINYKENHNGSFDGVTQDKEIGHLVLRVRQAYKGKPVAKLTPEMISQIEEIGFTWGTSYCGQWFEPFLTELKRYKKEHNGSFKGVTQDEKIGNLVGSVRRAYKGNGRFKYKLTPEMIEKLNEIDFPFVAEKDWFTPFFKELKKYKEKNGNFYGITQDAKIGLTVGRVRHNYKMNKLPEEIINKLNEINFTWEAEYGTWFSQFLENLKEYKNINGDFYGVATDPKIGYTVGMVRQMYKGNREQKLTPEMISQLEEIGFPWDGRLTNEGKLVQLTAERIQNKKWFNFDLLYNELLKYKARYGNINIPTTYTTVIEQSNEQVTYNLGGIISNVRRAKKKLEQGEKPLSHILTDEQYKMLNDIGFVWEVKRGRRIKNHEHENDFEC